MADPIRFADRNWGIGSFYGEVLIICPSCGNQGIASADFQAECAKMLCTACGLNKAVPTTVLNYSMFHPAHTFFNAKLWLEHPFKNEIFYAYNYQHLDYLEQYISATLREHKDRSGFTLLEKLPKFYHTSKNRSALLKLIETLRRK